jgi:predicted lysophospholipase L1 biosynthesis ABC-type transport system permease subunit
VSVYFDSRVKKMAADVVDVRVELALSALATALGAVIAAAWEAPIPIVLALTALVVIQGAARIGRARASERRLLMAIGAADGYAVTLSRIEGACFGGCAALVALLVSLSVAMVGGAWSSESVAWSGVWLVVTTVVAAASASLAAEPGW